MTKARYPLRLPLNKAQLVEIGHVAALWAYLESEIDFAICDILTALEERGRTITREERRMQKRFRDRTNQLKELAAEFYPDQRRTDKMATLLDRALNLKPKRDHIVHGRWRATIDETGQPGEDFSATRYMLDSAEPIKTEDYPVPKVEKLAASLSTLARDFLAFSIMSIRNSPPPSPGTYIVRDR